MKHVGSLGNTFIDKYNREARETGKTTCLSAGAGTSAAVSSVNVRWRLDRVAKYALLLH